MYRFRSLLLMAALGPTAFLGGCVAYPAYPSYPAYGYGSPYYGSPYYGGGYVGFGGGWHERHEGGWHRGGWREGHEGGWRH